MDGSRQRSNQRSIIAMQLAVKFMSQFRVFKASTALSLQFASDASQDSCMSHYSFTHECNHIYREIGEFLYDWSEFLDLHCMPIW